MGHSTFFIEDVQGEERIQKLEKFLLSLPGVERALIDIDDGEVKIEYLEKEIELNQIAENIESYGFTIRK